MKTKTKGLIVFLLISFGGSWLWGMYTQLVLGLSPINFLFQIPAAFMPAIAAIIVRLWVTREGFRDAGLALRFKSAWPYYLMAWLGPLFLAAATMTLAAVLGVWEPDLSLLNNVVPGIPSWWVVPLLLLVVPLLSPVYWGEEFGWTSYLRPRLFPNRLASSIIATGLIWAVWHYPLAFIGYIEFNHIVIGLLIWTGSFLCQETLLAWLYLRSGTIWTASLAHAGNNMVLFLLTGLLLEDGGGVDSLATTILTAIPIAAICLWLIFRRAFTGDSFLPGRLSQHTHINLMSKMRE